jgi:hypothetical protein
MCKTTKVLRINQPPFDMCCQRNVYAKQPILNNMTNCQLTKINILTAVELRLQFHNSSPLSRAANLLMTDSKSTEYNVFLRRFIMNESALCYRRMDVWMDVCNEMYCDETTNAANIPFGTKTI